MASPLTVLSHEAETVADLRDLYRASEARAARLRLLSTIGQALGVATAATLDAALERCVQDLAFFLGKPQGRLLRMAPDPGDVAIPVFAPGKPDHAVAWLELPGIPSLDVVSEQEERDTCRLCLDLIGATIDRFAREAERDALLAALGDREQRLETLVSRIFSAQEEERRRVSHELHDGVAQTMTALVRMIEGGGRQAPSGMSAAERERMAEIGRGLLRDLRAVIGGLRPPLLDDLGLAAALQTMADGLRADGYAVTLDIQEGPERLAPHVETAMFRVAQEALANVRKHAGGPCGVTIRLALPGEAPGMMQITDEGCGIDSTIPQRSPASDGGHFGIAVMRERMAALGGKLAIDAGPAGGTRVTATLPGMPAA